jgi:hypothetical protein
MSMETSYTKRCFIPGDAPGAFVTAGGIGFFVPIGVLAGVAFAGVEVVLPAAGAFTGVLAGVAVGFAGVFAAGVLAAGFFAGVVPVVAVVLFGVESSFLGVFTVPMGVRGLAGAAAFFAGAGVEAAGFFA